MAKRQTITAGFAKQLYNPQCFLVYEDPRVPPPMWEVRGETVFIVGFDNMNSEPSHIRGTMGGVSEQRSETTVEAII